MQLKSQAPADSRGRRRALTTGVVRVWGTTHDDWVFASARRAGKQLCWPDGLLRKRVRPAADKAGITVPIGWHTFRRSFSSWLKSGGAGIKVVQELMRHANLRTTMEL
jgi:integrase